MEVRVQGTDMDPSQYDPRDWTQVLRAQANLRETRNASHGTPILLCERRRASRARLRRPPQLPGYRALRRSCAFSIQPPKRSSNYRPFHPTDLKWCSAPREALTLRRSSHATSSPLSCRPLR
ncbi:hypothetical protein MRX96_041246 [Rhipicephalus microplus]